MIYLLGALIHSRAGALGLLRLSEYLTVRAIGAALTAIILTLIITPRFIWYLHRRGLVDQLRDTGVPFGVRQGRHARDGRRRHGRLHRRRHAAVVQPREPLRADGAGRRCCGSARSASWTTWRSGGRGRATAA